MRLLWGAGRAFLLVVVVVVQSLLVLLVVVLEQGWWRQLEERGRESDCFEIGQPMVVAVVVAQGVSSAAVVVDVAAVAAVSAL